MSEGLGSATRLGEVLSELARTIDARAGADPERSWTARLLAAGPALAAKKLGEEAVETALAVVSQDETALASEAADLVYHLLVALRTRGVPLEALARALADRQGQSGLAEKAARRDQPG